MPRFSSLVAQWSAIASMAILAACTEPNRQPMQIGGYHIAFDPGSFSIGGPGQRTIYAVADAVKSNSASSITIVGRTDAAGSPDYNMQLSKKRAIAVHDALLATGQIRPDQIETSWTSERLAPAGTVSTVAAPGSRVVDIFVQ